MLETMRRHAEKAGAEFRDGRVVSALPSGGQWYVGIGSDMEHASALILAAGVARGKPAMAPTDLFPGLEMEGGYVKTDRRMATNLPGLFAAGDCTGGPLQVSKAAGEGLTAGQSAAAYASEASRKARTT